MSAKKPEYERLTAGLVRVTVVEIVTADDNWQEHLQELNHAVENLRQYSAVQVVDCFRAVGELDKVARTLDKRAHWSLKP